MSDSDTRMLVRMAFSVVVLFIVGGVAIAVGQTMAGENGQDAFNRGLLFAFMPFIIVIGLFFLIGFFGGGSDDSDDEEGDDDEPAGTHIAEEG